MPINTNHNNEEVDVEIVADGFSQPANNDDITSLLTNVLKSKDDIEPVDIDSLVGDSTLDDGGTIGRLLVLARAHLEAAVKNGELSKQQVGEAYAGVISQALGQGIQMASTLSELSIKQREADLNAALLSIQVSEAKSKAELQYYQMINQKYSTIELLPLERELKKEQIHDAHVKHEISKFELDNVLPEELLTSVAKRGIAEKDLALKEYNLTEIMPKELAIKTEQVKVAVQDALMKKYQMEFILPAEKLKIESEVRKTDAQKLGIDLEVAVKQYYKDNIQKYEKDLAQYKSSQEGVNAGFITDKPTSLPARRMEQLVEQTSLYNRQKTHYDDIKNQKLLDTMMNYNAMIFPDNTAPDKLIGWAAYTKNSEDVAKQISSSVNTPPAG